jgi:hypothetical protein
LACHIGVATTFHFPMKVPAACAGLCVLVMM